jgi:cytochrome c-type biogenesis protein CcmH
MRYIFMIILFCATLSFANDVRIYPFEVPAQEAQFHGLLTSLRCLVCQNQNLLDSHAPLAEDLKKEIYDLVLLGRSDSEIMTFLTSRYGDFILFNPPFKGVTVFLWLAPVGFLLLGAIIFIVSFRPRKQSC